MRLEHLYYFVKVAERRSLTLASTELFLSQQALSIAIKNLENEFHTQLFIRHHRGVSLTDEGHYFYDLAIKILALSDELNQHFLSPQDRSYAALTIAINDRTKEHFFPKVISHFYKEYPQFQITYNSMLNQDIIDSIIAQEAELGILPMVAVDGRFLTALPEELHFEPFIAHSCQLSTCSDSPLAHYKTLSMTTLLKYPLILNIQADAESDLIYQLISHYSSQAQIIYADSYSLQAQMALDNVGNILTTQSPSPSMKALHSITITNDIQITNGFLTHTHNNANPLLPFFIEKARTLLPTGPF